MRRAIIHVGLPRTGTTSVQRLLDSRRAALLDMGILYPELTPTSAGERHLSHQHLGEALDGRRPRGERRELLALLEGRLDEAEIVLLSYEGLALLPWWRRGPQKLARLFARHGFAMELMATVKPQAELLNSTYTWRMQFLREGRAFADFFHAELGGRNLDMARLLERWMPPSGRRLTLVPVRDRLSQAPLAVRIFDALGLEAAGRLFSDEDLAVRENVSPGPFAVAVDRRLRQSGAHRRIGRHVRDATRMVESAVRDAGYDMLRFNGLDVGRRAHAEVHWRASNDRLAQLAWGTSWAERVDDEPAAPINELHPEAMTPAERRVRDAIASDVLARFRGARSGNAWWS